MANEKYSKRQLKELLTDLAGEDGVITQDEIERYEAGAVLRAQLSADENLVRNGKVHLSDISHYAGKTGAPLNNKYVLAMEQLGPINATHAYSVARAKTQDAVFEQVLPGLQVPKDGMSVDDLLARIPSEAPAAGAAQAAPRATTKHEARVADREAQDRGVVNKIMRDLGATGPDDLITPEMIQNYQKNIQARRFIANHFNADKDGILNAHETAELTPDSKSALTQVSGGGDYDIAAARHQDAVFTHLIHQQGAIPAVGIKVKTLMAKWTPMAERESLPPLATKAPARQTDSHTEYLSAAQVAEWHSKENPQSQYSWETGKQFTPDKAHYMYNLENAPGSLVIDASDPKYLLPEHPITVSVVGGKADDFSLKFKHDGHNLSYRQNQDGTLSVYMADAKRAGEAEADQHLVLTLKCENQTFDCLPKITSIDKDGRETVVKRDARGESRDAQLQMQNQTAAAAQKTKAASAQEQANTVRNELLDTMDADHNGVISRDEVNAQKKLVQQHKMYAGIGTERTAEEIKKIADHKKGVDREKFIKGVSTIAEKNANGDLEISSERMASVKYSDAVFDKMLRNGDFSPTKILKVEDMKSQDAPNPGNSYASNSPAPSGKGIG